MKYGISTVVATVLMLMITIALAGTAYMYIIGVFTARVASFFSIVDVYGNSIFIRNDGTEAIRDIDVTIDGKYASFILVPLEGEIDELFNIESSQVFEHDYLIKYSTFLVNYLSAKFNNGHIVDYRRIGSFVDLTGAQAVYPHFIVGYLQDGEWKWSDGNFENIEIKKLYGKYVEFSHSYFDSTIGFRSSAFHFLYNSSYFVQKVITTFEATKDITNVVDLYVEFGWDYNNFAFTAVKNKDNQIISKNMQGNPGAHYFADQKIIKNNWIAAYGSSVYDASVAFVFDYAKRINPDGTIEDISEIVPISWDTNGIVDQTDTIELHVIEAEWTNPVTIPAGTKYVLSYYILVSNGEQNYEWIDNVEKEIIDIVKPGSLGIILVHDPLPSRINKVRICTFATCQVAYLTIF